MGDVASSIATGDGGNRLGAFGGGMCTTWPIMYFNIICIVQAIEPSVVCADVGAIVGRVFPLI